MKGAFYNLGENILNSFKKFYVWHLTAILLTILFVFSGFDWWYHLHTLNPTIQSILFPAVILGGILPIVLPVAFFTMGHLINRPRILNMSFAIAQSAFLGWLISSIYKFFTGRIPPPFRTISAGNLDISHVFHLGFYRGGIFWGWPSSHTTVAFAVALTLVVLFPDKKWVKVLAILFAFYIGIGVSISIHWFSDFVAGAIIGTAIGITVGKIFLKRFASKS